MVFNAGPSYDANWTALKAHYVDKFGRNDVQHTQLLREHCEQLEAHNDVCCLVCRAEFLRLSDLFQHVASKCRNIDDMVSVAHRSHFDAIVLPFVGKLLTFRKYLMEVLIY